MGTAKCILYGTAVLCFVGAGVLDLCARQWKLGVIALMFAAVNAVMFFWR